MSSGRRKSRFSVNDGAPAPPNSARSFISTSSSSDYPEGRKPRSSVAMEGDYPSGRQPRSSVAMEGDFPEGRKPRSSVAMGGDFPEGRQPRGSVAMEGDNPSGGKKKYATVIKEGEFKEEEEIDPEEEEREAKRRRKRIAMLIACVLALVMVIVIIVIVLNVLKTGDEPPSGGGGDTGVPEACAINNETKPATFDDFMCDLMTTVTTSESTFLRTYPLTTHYGRTIAWMTTSDRTDYENLPREHVLERFVMILLYFSTGGREWYTKFEFLTQQHVCDWTGDSTSAIRCGFSDRKVTDLGMPQNGMNGEVPSEIGYLTGLTRIYFSINQLTGKIPSEIGKLTNLKKLYFDRNNMRGKIPPEINALNLTTLALNNNDFNGNLTEICDAATAKAAAVEGFEFDYHSDCDTGRVNCPCCVTCV